MQVLHVLSKALETVYLHQIYIYNLSARHAHRFRKRGTNDVLNAPVILVAWKGVHVCVCLSKKLRRIRGTNFFPLSSHLALRPCHGRSVSCLVQTYFAVTRQRILYSLFSFFTTVLEQNSCRRHVWRPLPAFGLVGHVRVTSTGALTHYAIRGHAPRVIRFHVTIRKQTDNIHNMQSEIIQTLSHAPQGTILASLFLWLPVTILQRLFEIADFKYAGDTNVPFSVCGGENW